MLMDPSALSNLLTLRYDPLKRPIRKRLSKSDFKPLISYDNNFESRIFEIIQKELLKKYDELKFSYLSLSLSGGVDSRLTLAMIRMILPDVRVDCIAVGFGDKDDEIEQAKEISDIYDCKFHEVIIEDVLSELPKLIKVAKEPKWNLYQYYPLEYAKRCCSNVLFTGDGGDELFGGYTFRYNKFLSLLTKDMGWKTKAKLYLSCHERDWVPDQTKMFGPAVKFSWEKIYRLFEPYFDNDLEPLNQVFLADFNGKLLYDWLPVNKAFADHLEIKIESIFLTHAMIEFATHMPWQKKYDPQTKIGKIPLRSILVNHKGNEKMLLNAVKKGFSIDLGTLWKKNAREIVSRYVNTDSEVVKKGIIDKRWISKTTAMLKENDGKLDSRYISKMLSILALEVWFRLFVSKTMSDKQRL